MNRRNACSRLLLGSALSLTPWLARAADKHDHDDDDGGEARLSVGVAFGVGLNTAQPGNSANHHVLPRVIRVKRGGVVHFNVSGFHQPMVYFPGVTPETIAVPSAPALFINDTKNLYYRGIAPAGGPPPGTPATADPSNASNRVESVSFAEPGDYLVICNVRPHFLDGMYATIRVR
jgi:hypothetical protein